MRLRIVLIMLVLLAIGSATAFAGSSTRIGTAGATELLIPVGSRGTAMGGAITANAEGVESVFWNPAGLASLQGTEAMFMHLPYLASIDVNFAGVATAIEGFGTLAATAKIVSIGNIEETTDAFSEGTGNVYSPTLAVIGLTYARTLTANVQFGVTGMLVTENIFQVKATGAAFDVGVIYDPRWKGFRFGIAIKNYGPNMTFSGEGFDQAIEGVSGPVASHAADFELPGYVSMGVAYDLYNRGSNLVTLAGNYRSNNFSEDMQQFGAEYSFDQRYFLRAGYVTSTQDNFMFGATLGAGLTVPLGSSKLSFEYSWRDTRAVGLSDNHFFTLRADF